MLDALPLTDVGKATKVPLRMNALRDAVLAELAAAGIRVDAGDIVCASVGGRPHVTLLHLADAAGRGHIMERLNRYSYDWEFAVSPE
ncbi:hypothetical protein ACIP98_35495 [Streptomyces sp. NPDC088354]|uniref:hypothetical protein n=1 Tax=Streptomyces sp. NPDC088354 TaxID=3365856 RepID=UPI003815D9C3